MSLHQKKFNKCKSDQLEKAVLLFVHQRHQAQSNNIPLNGPLIKTKSSIEFADKLKYGSFKASDGWFAKFMNRNNLSRQKICGESNNVNIQEYNFWKNNTLQQLLDSYEPKNIFNADETGLFYRCLPEHTYAIKNTSCHGGKLSKDRLTILIGANMDGTEKLALLVIGKSKHPICFKNVNSLPVLYENNNKNWMTSLIFERWILTLDQIFAAKNRKILLFVDNCTAHPKSIVERLRYIRLAFLPPNMTSVAQLWYN